MKVVYFKTPKEFRAWLATHHIRETELWVGYHRKDSGHPSMTWPESVDEALCYGWIDGIRRKVDETRYAIRFTPRRPGSIWSRINIGRAQALIASGAMRPPGLAAFEARTSKRSGVYSFEQRSADLAPEYARTFRRDRAAWKFYQAQPASYRKAANWWVVSAKQETTRLSRLAKLIAHSRAGERLDQFNRRPKKT